MRPRPAPQVTALVAHHRGGPAFSDAELVARALEGSAWAQAALCRAHAGPLIGMLTRMLGRASDADDIAQDALVVALRTLPSLRAATAFKPWLYGIATNLARKLLRRRKLERWLGVGPADAETTLESLISAGASPEDRAELSLIDARLAKLPADLRVAWCLRFVEGYELTEVAALCQCSLATIKRKLDKATERLGVRVDLEGR